MSSSLAYSTFEKEGEKEGFPSTGRKRKNKTIKKNSKKVETFLNGLASMDNDDDDNSNLADLGDFPPQPQITKQPEPSVENKTSTDEAVSPAAYAQMSADDSSNLNYQNYYNTYIPYSDTPTNNANLHGSKDELMKKLNYMIHLLEENKDEKTSNVTEELVLYMFLGVFVIFVVDSFARAGKYIR
tara:strand:- start:659 stop:1213 length:555 start_codon:yes stop_codon:yes gene_type:complete